MRNVRKGVAGEIGGRGSVGADGIKEMAFAAIVSSPLQNNSYKRVLHCHYFYKRVKNRRTIILQGL